MENLLSCLHLILGMLDDIERVKRGECDLEALTMIYCIYAREEYTRLTARMEDVTEKYSYKFPLES